VSQSEKRRTYGRLYARRQREADLAAKMARATRCPFQLGIAKCDTLLELVTVNGRVIATCRMCERRKRGICRDCHLPVAGTVGRALRCAVHKLAATRLSQAQHRDENREAVNERARLAAQQPERRARNLLVKRLRRLLQPEKVKREKRRALITHNAARERYLAHHRKLNAKRARKLRKRAMALLDYYRANPVRPVPTCKGCSGFLDWQPKPGGNNGRPPSWCDGCCNKYELARRRKLGRAITVVPDPPALAYTPPLYILEKKIGPRMCLGAGCLVVMKGRAKKCAACKQREIEAMRVLLEAHSASGRKSA
jgi:hypothetical protein